MLYRLFEFPRRRVLGTHLNVRQYGHQGLEMAMSFALAKREAAAVCFLRPRQVVSEAMFEIEPDDVTVLRGPVARALARTAWMCADGTDSAAAFLTRFWAVSRREATLMLDGQLDANRGRKSVQDGIKKAQRWIKRLGDPKPRAVGPPLYYQRRLLRERQGVHLRPAALAAARASAQAVGLDPDAPIVTLHVREAGWKFGREMQDAKPGSRDDSTRNAQIAHYHDAIDELVSRGFVVVRLGDPSMTPIARAGVVDLATSDRRSNLLELYCMLRSAFFISGEAGPVGVCYLTGTPLLTVNATDPISSYPIRADGLFIPKTVLDRTTRRPLSLGELVSEDHLSNLRNVARFTYQENTPEEIRSAVLEMLEWTGGVRHETPEQVRFRELAAEAGEQFRTSLNYVRKWGSDRGFIGDGLVCRFYAERNQ